MEPERGIGLGHSPRPPQPPVSGARRSLAACARCAGRSGLVLELLSLSPPTLPPTHPSRPGPRFAQPLTARRAGASPPRPPLSSSPPRGCRRRLLLFAPLSRCPPAAPTPSPPSSLSSRLPGLLARKPAPYPSSWPVPRGGRARTQRATIPLQITQRGERERERAATPGSGLGCAAGQRIRVSISSARPRLPRSATEMRCFPSFRWAIPTRVSRSPRLPAGASARTLPGAVRPGPRALGRPAPRPPPAGHAAPGPPPGSGGGGGEADFNHCHFI